MSSSPIIPELLQLLGGLMDGRGEYERPTVALRLVEAPIIMRYSA